MPCPNALRKRPKSRSIRPIGPVNTGPRRPLHGESASLHAIHNRTISNACECMAIFVIITHYNIPRPCRLSLKRAYFSPAGFSVGWIDSGKALSSDSGASFWIVSGTTDGPVACERNALSLFGSVLWTCIISIDLAPSSLHRLPQPAA